MFQANSKKLDKNSKQLKKNSKKLDANGKLLRKNAKTLVWLPIFLFSFFPRFSFVSPSLFFRRPTLLRSRRTPRRSRPTATPFPRRSKKWILDFKSNSCILHKWLQPHMRQRKTIQPQTAKACDSGLHSMLPLLLAPHCPAEKCEQTQSENLLEIWSNSDHLETQTNSKTYQKQDF